jgi:hypothetical protein
VTAPGYHDEGQDGLFHAHRSAIFDGATRRAVVETTLRPRSPLGGLFRWEPVGPVVLGARHEYVIVSSREKPLDPEVPNPRNASLAPQLCYLRFRRSRENGSGWGVPDGSPRHPFVWQLLVQAGVGGGPTQSVTGRSIGGGVVAAVTPLPGATGSATPGRQPAPGTAGP